MDAYCVEIRKLEGKFYGIEYHHVVRDQNQLVDHLSKIGSSRAMIPPRVFIQDLFTPSIKEEKEVQEMPPTEQLVLVPLPAVDWREQLIKYLTSADVPAKKIRTNANPSQQALHAGRRKLDEEKCQGRDTAEMHHPKRSETTSQNSLCFLWQPRGLEKPGRQGFSSWFLLAYG